MLEATPSQQWENLLTAAFEILLERPLSSYVPDAAYAAFFGGNLLREVGYDRRPDWLDAAALAGRKTIAIDDLSLYYLDEPPLRFDASGSVFEFDMDALPAAVASKIAAARFAGGTYSLITGRALGWATEGFSPDELGQGWSVAYPRIASDGSLWDAMRVALGLGLDASSLIPWEGEACAPWGAKLAAIPHQGLRAHLAIGCAEPWDGDGLCYLGSTRSGGSILEDQGCALIANWEEGQCQREVAIVQLGASVV